MGTVEPSKYYCGSCTFFSTFPLWNENCFHIIGYFYSMCYLLIRFAMRIFPIDTLVTSMRWMNINFHLPNNFVWFSIFVYCFVCSEWETVYCIWQRAISIDGNLNIRTMNVLLHEMKCYDCQNYDVMKLAQMICIYCALILSLRIIAMEILKISVHIV